jgi:hypothetical protein
MNGKPPGRISRKAIYKCINKQELHEDALVVVGEITNYQEVSSA